jgi:hydroxymethylpyrimidine/phosphomethylpyrimidine kinase
MWCSVVADAIRRHRCNVVLDPVMVATSGDRLIAETPRRAGARAVPAGHGGDAQSGRSSLLLGRTIDGIDALDAAASDCWRWARGRAAQGRASARRLGGGRAGRAGRQRRTLESQRIATHNGHGTGCTLSSAIASTWPWACRWPMPWRRRAATSWAPSVRAAVRTGHGHGPLNHGHAPVARSFAPTESVQRRRAPASPAVADIKTPAGCAPCGVFLVTCPGAGGLIW